MDPIQTADSVLNEALDAEKEVKDQNDLSLFYNRFLSKKGKASTLMTLMKEVKGEHKAAFGKKVNEVKASIVSFYEAKKKELEQKELEEKLRKERIDITLSPAKATSSEGRIPSTRSSTRSRTSSSRWATRSSPAGTWRPTTSTSSS